MYVHVQPCVTSSKGTIYEYSDKIRYLHLTLSLSRLTFDVTLRVSISFYSSPYLKG